MDIQQHFIEAGQGQPLILLHGNGESSAYFQGQIGPFAREYHVFAPDTRGHGQTPRGEAPFTIRQFAEDLLAFLDAHEIRRAHLLGFSDGGNIAMDFALRYPERVDRLILNGANLSPAGVKRTVQLPIEIGYRIAKRFAGRSDAARRKAELLGLMVLEPHVPPAALAAIRAKTLVIAGTRDMIRAEHTRLIAERIPNAELVFLPGDHFIAGKCPEAFNRAVLAFLRS